MKGQVRYVGESTYEVELSNGSPLRYHYFTRAEIELMSVSIESARDDEDERPEFSIPFYEDTRPVQHTRGKCSCDACNE